MQVHELISASVEIAAPEKYANFLASCALYCVVNAISIKHIMSAFMFIYFDYIDFCLIYACEM